MTFRLDQLTSSGKKRKRVGRGGSRGGTSGKGHKGQKARSGGGISPAFEGGQMPLHRRLPKRGFTNARFKKEIEILSIGSLENFFQSGDQVTKELLVEKGILKPKKSRGPFLLKILGDGSLTKKLSVQADLFSKTASKAIQDVGGEAVVIKGE
jgi:large subunit ribosomal protein L15